MPLSLAYGVPPAEGEALRLLNRALGVLIQLINWRTVFGTRYGPGIRAAIDTEEFTGA